MNNCFIKVGNRWLVISDLAFPRTPMKKAFGFIIDGDHAVYWKKDGHQAQHRSGTLQIVSRHLHVGYIENEPKLHLAIDDLESFIWLAMWTALFSTDQETRSEQGPKRTQSGHDLAEVFSAKESLYYHIIFKRRRVSQSLWEPLPLLEEWFRIADAAETTLDLLIENYVEKSDQPDHEWESFFADLDQAAATGGFFEELEGLCLVYYKQYLEAGIKFLQERGAYGTEGKDT